MKNMINICKRLRAWLEGRVGKSRRGRVRGGYVVGVLLTLTCIALLATERVGYTMISDLYNITGGGRSLGEASQTEKFRNVLKELGHEPPRRYRLDGNVVYISVRSSEMSLQELTSEYIDAFRDHGLNRRWVGRAKGEGVSKVEQEVLRAKDNALNDALTAINGGLVPVVTTPDYVRLSGAEPRNDTRVTFTRDLDNPGHAIAKTLRQLKEMQADGPEHVFKAVRSVELFASRGKTDVVATFTDDDFEISRSLDQKRGSGAGKSEPVGDTELLLPCRSCHVIHRFEDLDPDVTFAATTFHATEPPTTIRTYYDTLYRNRGWLLEPTNTDITSPGLGMRRTYRPGPNASSLPKNLKTPSSNLITTLVIMPQPNGVSIVDLKILDGGPNLKQLDMRSRSDIMFNGGN